MSFFSDRSLARIHTQRRRHPGTIGSQAGIRIHARIYNSDSPGTNPDTSGLIPLPTGCGNSNPARRL